MTKTLLRSSPLFFSSLFKIIGSELFSFKGSKLNISYKNAMS
ncbi:Hypothetical protein Minf_0194 [Methylacidiphilum infernorum V4]|uniref:Uncharacterized protein n=1 Tax=Methylacidiphilum infernorum (isolate V4) TaxID=481448 RepID=B3DXM0_METI4|nr:Hypothetical protein Minf_0194 [Methylacidiphilum infernorum V4]